uniref:Uncharacterized protein n=1 Tax=Poecilia reticulata TaxID=8081 RepID=A0A3P9N740_POERE
PHYTFGPARSDRLPTRHQVVVSGQNVKSIIRKLKEFGSTTTLPKKGRSPKLTNQTSRRIIDNEIKNVKHSPAGAAGYTNKLYCLII